MSTIEIKAAIVKPNLFPECSNCKAIEPSIDNSFDGIGEAIQSTKYDKIEKVIIGTFCRPLDASEFNEVWTTSFRSIVVKNVSHSIQTSNRKLHTCPGLVAKRDKE